MPLAFEYAAETLHIALVSLPQRNVIDHVKSLQTHFYDEYLKEIKEFSVKKEHSDDLLFKPLKYYIFGNYDVALISLVNNYKFAQKQITPGSQKSEVNLAEPSFFQVINGSCPIIPASKPFNVREFFQEKQKKSELFICISSLKLNNKLLIGNGGFFLEPIEEFIKVTLDAVFGIPKDQKAHHFFLQQTNSWFELTLIIFSNEIDLITKSLTSLRKATLKDLCKEVKSVNKIELMRRSVYESMLKGTDQEDEFGKLNPHLFADTHSYFGVNFEYGQADAKFLEQQLKTQIEWQIKPGHFPDLYKVLNTLQAKREKIFSDESFLLTGKSDYIVSEKSDNLYNNLQIFTILRKNKKLFDYVRRVKTKVLLSYTADKRKSVHGKNHPDFKGWMDKKFIKKIDTPAQVNPILKQLKVSRNVRNKIKKIYYNYQNGIQDPILFTYFLDFVTFIRNLTTLISVEKTAFDDTFRFKRRPQTDDVGTVNAFEDKLLENIEVFDKGYSTRMLNAYHYEDINDFDLGYNSSIQQLLSVNTTLAADLSNLYYQRFKHAPVVQLHLKRTGSSYDAINYDVYHLNSPEFVFFTIVKEILNQYPYVNEKEIKQREEEKKVAAKEEAIATVTKKKKGVNKEPENVDNGRDIPIRHHVRRLQEHVSSCNKMRKFKDNIHIETAIFDSIVLLQTCNMDFKLFEYWFWTYNFQVASMYDTLGIFNEEHFKKELLRLFLIGKLFGFEPEERECPLPELYYLWERYAKEMAVAINALFEHCDKDVINDFKVSILSIQAYENVARDMPRDIQISSATAILWSDHISKYLLFDRKRKLPDERVTLLWSHLQHSSNMVDGITKELSEGRPYYCTSTNDDYYFINSFMYAYLKLIHKMNGEKVRLLRRNWKSGAPLKTFIRTSGDKFMYSVDQFGGIFFPSSECSQEYFKIRNAALQSLWHYSLLSKKFIYFDHDR